MRVLRVENDAQIGEASRFALKDAVASVDWVRRDGQAAFLAAGAAEHALVLLDLGLPRRNGLSVLEALRKRRVTVPIIVTDLELDGRGKYASPLDRNRLADRVHRAARSR